MRIHTPPPHHPPPLIGKLFQNLITEFTLPKISPKNVRDINCRTSFSGFLKFASVISEVCVQACNHRRCRWISYLPTWNLVMDILRKLVKTVQYLKVSIAVAGIWNCRKRSQKHKQLVFYTDFICWRFGALSHLCYSSPQENSTHQSGNRVWELSASFLAYIRVCFHGADICLSCPLISFKLWLFIKGCYCIVLFMVILMS